MKILLTQDQQSTLWHLTETTLLSNGDRLYSFPYFLIDKGEGLFERVTFDQLSLEAKELILTNRGIFINNKVNDNADTAY